MDDTIQTQNIFSSYLTLSEDETELIIMNRRPTNSGLVKNERVRQNDGDDILYNERRNRMKQRGKNDDEEG